MGADRVVLIRHGESVWNAERRWQGQGGPGLSPLGQRQAAATAEFLAASETDVRLLVGSDLPRVTETAAPTADALGMAVKTDERLREIDVGSWSGLTHEQVAAVDAAELAAIDAGADLPRGGGESVADLRARVAPAVADLVDSCDGGTALLFCHGGPVRAVVGDLLGLSVIAERTLGGPGNCSRTILTRRNGRLQLRAYNDTGHLHGIA